MSDLEAGAIIVNIAVHVQPADLAPVNVEYRWDADTDILSARFDGRTADARGMSGSVELTGSDGSWVVLDVGDGHIRGVEIAVWPDVKKVATLVPPSDVADAKVTVPARASQPGVALVQVDARLLAEADASERTIHFRLGGARPARTLRIARDVLLEVNDRDLVTGLWLLNVPPFPAAE